MGPGATGPDGDTRRAESWAAGIAVPYSDVREERRRAFVEATYTRPPARGAPLVAKAKYWGAGLLGVLLVSTYFWL